mgnify:CR=1 FL=1
MTVGTQCTKLASIQTMPTSFCPRCCIFVILPFINLQRFNLRLFELVEKYLKIKRPVTMGIVTKPCCQLQRNKTNYESKFSPKMTVKCQEKVLKCDKPEIQS